MQARFIVIACLLIGAGCSLFIDTGGFESGPESLDASATGDASAATDATNESDGTVAPDTSATTDGASDASTRDVALVGDWNFDEGAGSAVLDKSGAGHNGIIFGGLWVADQYGTEGSALMFDGGASSHVAISGATDFDRSAAPSFTMTAWARIDETPSHDMFYSVNFGTQDSAFGIEILDATTLTYWDSKDHIAQAAVPNVVGQWHHYAVVVDGTEARVFFDGVRLNKGTADTTPRASSQLFFGRSSFGNTMNGAVDRARFFRSALTDAEVMAEKNR